MFFVYGIEVEQTDRNVINNIDCNWKVGWYFVVECVAGWLIHLKKKNNWDENKKVCPWDSAKMWHQNPSQLCESHFKIVLLTLPIPLHLSSVMAMVCHSIWSI